MKNITNLIIVCCTLLLSSCVFAQELRVMQWEDFFSSNSSANKARMNIDYDALEQEFSCSVPVISIYQDGKFDMPLTHETPDILFFSNFDNHIYQELTPQIKAVIPKIRVINIDLKSWNSSQSNSFKLNDFTALQYVSVQADSMQKLEAFISFVNQLPLDAKQTITLVTKINKEAR